MSPSVLFGELQAKQKLISKQMDLTVVSIKRVYGEQRWEDVMQFILKIYRENTDEMQKKRRNVRDWSLLLWR